VRHKPSMVVVASIKVSSFDVTEIIGWRRVVWVVVVLMIEVFICRTSCDEFCVDLIVDVGESLAS
jgi:hypothetical protein